MIFCFIFFVNKIFLIQIMRSYKKKTLSVFCRANVYGLTLKTLFHPFMYNYMIIMIINIITFHYKSKLHKAFPFLIICMSNIIRFFFDANVTIHVHTEKKEKK